MPEASARKTLGESVRKILIAATSRIAALVSGILIVPLSVRYLPPSQFTYWALLSTIVGGLSLFDLGLSGSVANSMLREKRSDIALDSRRGLAAIYQTRRVLAPISIAITGVGLILAAGASHITLHTNMPGFPGCIAAVTAGLGVLLSGSTNALIAMRRVNHFYVITGIASVLQLIVCLVVILIHPSVASLLLVPIVNLLAAPILSLVMLRFWAYGRAGLISGRLGVAVEKRDLSGNGAAAYQLANLGGAGMQYVPSWLLASLSTPLAVAQFQLGQRAFSVIFGFMHLFMSDFWVKAFSDRHSPRAFSVDVRRALYLALVLCATVAIVLRSALPSVTDGVSIGWPSLVLWTIWVVIQTFGLSLFYAASFRKYYRLQERSAVATVLTSFGLCSLGAIIAGDSGVVGGMVSAYLACSVAPYVLLLYGKSRNIIRESGSEQRDRVSSDISPKRIHSPGSNTRGEAADAAARGTSQRAR